MSRFRVIHILLIWLPLAPPTAGAVVDPQYEEREALRQGHQLTWAECLRRQADAPQAQEQRTALLAAARSGGLDLTTADAVGCAIWLRDDGFEWPATDLEALAEALADSLTPLPAAGADQAVREAWVVFGLRCFDTARDNVFVDAAQGSWSAVPAESGADPVRALRAILEAVRAQPAQGQDQAPQTSTADVGALVTLANASEERTQAEIQCFVGYLKWAQNERANAITASAANGPTTSKIELVRLFQREEAPQDQGLLGRLAGEFAASGCVRWELDALLLQKTATGIELETMPNEVRALYAGRASVLDRLRQTSASWYASRAELLGWPGALSHDWWKFGPGWWDERLALEAQIDPLLGNPGTWAQAFELVQQAKCLPLIFNEDTEQRTGTVNALQPSEFAGRFSAPTRPFYQLAYVEYYWGENTQGVFYVVNEPSPATEFAGHSGLRYQPLTNAARLDQELHSMAQRLRSGSLTRDAGRCGELLPMQVVRYSTSGPQRLCDINDPRVMIAPDGPLWGVPFEALLNFPAAQDRGYDGSAFVSYTVTAAALAADPLPGRAVRPGDWQDCWQANYERVFDDSLPDVSWVDMTMAGVQSFPLALAPWSLGANERRARSAIVGGSLSFSAFQDLRYTLRNEAGSQSSPLAWILVETGPQRF